MSKGWLRSACDHTGQGTRSGLRDKHMGEPRRTKDVLCLIRSGNKDVIPLAGRQARERVAAAKTAGGVSLLTGGAAIHGWRRGVIGKDGHDGVLTA